MGTDEEWQQMVDELKTKLSTLTKEREELVKQNKRMGEALEMIRKPLAKEPQYGEFDIAIMIIDMLKSIAKNVLSNLKDDPFTALRKKVDEQVSRMKRRKHEAKRSDYGRN